jgi:hypothetical protein
VAHDKNAEEAQLTRRQASRARAPHKKKVCADLLVLFLNPSSKSIASTPIIILLSFPSVVLNALPCRVLVLVALPNDAAQHSTAEPTQREEGEVEGEGKGRHARRQLGRGALRHGPLCTHGAGTGELGVGGVCWFFCSSCASSLSVHCGLWLVSDAPPRRSVVVPRSAAPDACCPRTAQTHRLPCLPHPLKDARHTQPPLRTCPGAPLA